MYKNACIESNQAGTESKSESKDLKQCKHCGQEIPKEAVFCAFCGKQVEGRVFSRNLASSD